MFERLGRTTVANGPVGPAVRVAQITEVADAASVLVKGSFGKGLVDLDHFEGESGGRSDWVGKHTSLAEAAEGEDFSLEIRTDAGFFTEGKRCADLNSSGTQALSLREFTRTAVRTGQPKGQTQGSDFFQLGDVARAIQGFTGGGELKGTPRRSIVSAGSRTFDNESVDAAVGFPGESHSQGRGRNNADELGPLQWRHNPAAKAARVESREVFLAGESALDVDAELGWFASGQEVDYAWNGTGNAGAHQDIVHIGKHCAED